MTASGNSTFHGTVSSDASVLVATATVLGGNALLIAQRAGTGLAATDLVGTWSFRLLEFWPGTLATWSYGKAAIAPDLQATLVEVAPSPGASGPVPVSMTADGLITLEGDPWFGGALSLDGSLIVGTTSADAGSTVELVVLQKQGAPPRGLGQPGHTRSRSLSSAG